MSAANNTITPKACMIPFTYPGYPVELLERFTRESEDMLKGLGLDITTSPLVINIADAAKARQTLRSADFDFIIPLILSWLEAPNVLESLTDYLHKPMLLWSHTMWRENGELLTLGPIPGVGVIRQTFEDMGLNFKFVYGMPSEKRVQDQIAIYAKAAAAVYRLHHSRIGLVGYPSMGMYTAMIDPLDLRGRIGPEIDQIDQYVLVKRIEEISDERVKPLVETAKTKWCLSEKVTDKDLAVTLKMYLGMRDLAKEGNWDALTIKCQYELSKYYHHTPCVSLSMLGDELTVSCEGDLPLITTQLVMHYLSGQTVSYADLHTIDGDDLLLGACGFAPFGMAKGKPEVDVTETLYEGLANCTRYKEGQVTIARLDNGRTGRYKMQIETGQAGKAPEFHEIGCLGYPSMQVKLDGDGDFFAQHLYSQHFGVVYADLKDLLEEFCQIANITPVSSLNSNGTNQ